MFNWGPKPDGWYIRWTWVNSVLIGLFLVSEKIQGG